VSPVYLFRRRRWSRPLYSLPVLQRLPFARLLCFELVLFGLFAAANLFGGRIVRSPRRFDLAWRAVCRLSFNPGSIEDYIGASDFDAAACRAAVHNALAQYCPARGPLDALDIDATIDDAIFNRCVIGRTLSLAQKRHVAGRNLQAAVQIARREMALLDESVPVWLNNRVNLVPSRAQPLCHRAIRSEAASAPNLSNRGDVSTPPTPGPTLYRASTPSRDVCGKPTGRNETAPSPSAISKPTSSRSLCRPSSRRYKAASQPKRHRASTPGRNLRALTSDRKAQARRKRRSHQRRPLRRRGGSCSLSRAYFTAGGDAERDSK
jgi:hypothetical protein